jgi:hypothetical protein
MSNICTGYYFNDDVNAKELLLPFAKPYANLSAIPKVTEQVMIY